MSKDYAHVLSTYAAVFDIHPLLPKRDLVNNHIIFFNLQYFFYLPTLSDQRQKSHSHKVLKPQQKNSRSAEFIIQYLW